MLSDHIYFHSVVSRTAHASISSNLTLWLPTKSYATSNVSGNTKEQPLLLNNSLLIYILTNKQAYNFSIPLWSTSPLRIDFHGFTFKVFLPVATAADPGKISELVNPRKSILRGLRSLPW